MMIIATTKNAISGKRRRSKQTYLVILLAALAVTGICVYFFGELAVFLLLAIFFIAPLAMHINSLWEVMPFTAWVKDGTLHFDYYTKDENGCRERHVVSFLILGIRAYTVHSFLKGAPAFIEITFDTGHEIRKSKPIYIEELSEVESNKLISFLDSLMVRRKVLKRPGGSPDQQRN